MPGGGYRGAHDGRRHRPAERAADPALAGRLRRARRPSRPRSVPARATSRSRCRSTAARRRGRCRGACRSSGTRRARRRTASSTASSRCSTRTSRPCARPASTWCASPTSSPRPSASRSTAATGARCVPRSRATVYDGASNLGAVRHDGVSTEALWFSDGLATYGEPWKLAFPVPVYAISSAAEQRPGRAAEDRRHERRQEHRPRRADAPATRPMPCCAAARSWSTSRAVGAKEIVVQSQGAAPGRLVARRHAHRSDRRDHAALARQRRQDDDPRTSP